MFVQGRRYCALLKESSISGTQPFCLLLICLFLLSVQHGTTENRSSLRTHLRFATWNVLSLANVGYQGKPLHMSSHVCNIAIAGLTETQIPQSGELDVGDYTVFHK